LATSRSELNFRSIHARTSPSRGPLAVIINESVITNLPSFKDFEKVSKECLIQSFNQLFNIYKKYYEYYEDETINNEVCKEEIWEHHSGTYRTIIILIYQAIETAMKAEVTKVTPFLLIEKNRNDWPTLPDNSNKDFDSLYTISGESLLNTFAAVNQSFLTTEKITFIENIRLLRNKAIHGADNLPTLNVKNLLANILETYILFYGKNSWFDDLKEFNLTNPLFGYYDWDIENIQSFEYLDFVLEIIGKKQLNKFTSLEINGREYFCPHCKHTFDGDYGYLESKWAFLNPNKPDSTTVECLNCNIKIIVERTGCLNEECKGNVISKDEELCLTCFEYQKDYYS